jgi:CheY-like chemotaxis protein
MAGSLSVTKEQTGRNPSRRVRVGIVDDSPEIRALLRSFLEADGRFEVVGEAADGKEAIRLAATSLADLLILDHQMPGMTGVAALPEIRCQAPATAVILYAGGTDATTEQAALEAGALAVLNKMAVGPSVVDWLADVLVSHWASPIADVEIRLGPVDAAAARAWVENTSKILAAVRAHAEVLDEPVPADVLEQFDRFLRLWGTLAAATDEFYWLARADVAEVERLVDCWARLDRMSDAQLQALGVHWSTPEGRLFFEALSACVLGAVSSRDEMQALARVLAGQWGEPAGTGPDR